MSWPNTKRVLRSGSVSFLRNPFISLTAIVMMMVPLFLLGSLVFDNFLLETELTTLQDKVDINVYFVTSANEKSILDLKTTLETLPEVSVVTYTSRDDAEKKFRAKHQDDQLTLQALDELGTNPFGAALSIRAKEVSQYAGIADFLHDRTTDSSGAPLIDDINYYQNKLTIAQLGDIIARSRQEKSVQVVFFSIIALFVIFNTIRLTIYHARDEIAVMRLVGASNTYIEGPFIVEGALYGVCAALAVLILLFPVTYWFGAYFGSFSFPSLTGEFSDMRVFDYYLSHFLYVSVLILAAGLFVSALSSFLAVRKYLSV